MRAAGWLALGLSILAVLAGLLIFGAITGFVGLLLVVFPRKF